MRDPLLLRLWLLHGVRCPDFRHRFDHIHSGFANRDLRLTRQAGVKPSATQSLLETPADSKVAIALWQAAAALTMPAASAAPVPSPSRIPSASSGVLPSFSIALRWPGSPDTWPIRQ